MIPTYNKLTDGFSLAQIRSSSLKKATHPSHLLSSLSIFDQPFTYLSKGCQCYAFMSADGRYILKFFKQKHLREPFPLFKNSIERRKRRKERLFSSIELAYHHLAKECGMIAVHLDDRVSVGHSVTLIDKLGFKRTINIDDYEWFLQERALPAKELFWAGISEEEAKRKITLLRELIESRCTKGIADLDHGFAQNVGFSVDGERAILMDVGQLSYDEHAVEKQELDLKSKMGNLRHFMQTEGIPFSHLLQD